MKVESDAPRRPASAWLKSVARRMPQMMGFGARKRAARKLRLVADFGRRDDGGGKSQGL